MPARSRAKYSGSAPKTSAPPPAPARRTERAPASADAIGSCRSMATRRCQRNPKSQTCCATVCGWLLKTLNEVAAVRADHGLRRCVVWIGRELDKRQSRSDGIREDQRERLRRVSQPAFPGHDREAYVPE